MIQKLHYVLNHLIWNKNADKGFCFHSRCGIGIFVPSVSRQWSQATSNKEAVAAYIQYSQYKFSLKISADISWHQLTRAEWQPLPVYMYLLQQCLQDMTWWKQWTMLMQCVSAQPLVACTGRECNKETMQENNCETGSEHYPSIRELLDLGFYSKIARQYFNHTAVLKLLKINFETALTCQRLWDFSDFFTYILCGQQKSLWNNLKTKCRHSKTTI